MMNAPAALQSNQARSVMFLKKPRACLPWARYHHPIVNRLRANLASQEIGEAWRDTAPKWHQGQISCVAPNSDGVSPPPRKSGCTPVRRASFLVPWPLKLSAKCRLCVIVPCDHPLLVGKPRSNDPPGRGFFLKRRNNSHAYRSW